MSDQTMSPAELQQLLTPIQARKGYFFNPDAKFTTDILEQLLVNKEHLGYMACPCRLNSGKREHDQDIICPCVYREPDVAEYGWCYCGLYVSQDWLDNKIPRDAYVPDRRPPALIL